MKKSIYFLFIINYIFAGCNTTSDCLNNYLTPVFIGFNFSELDTLIVRKYIKNDNFLHLLDTAIIVTDTASFTYITSNDTTKLDFNTSIRQAKYMLPDHDWQIYIPKLNRLLSISNIASPKSHEKCYAGGDLCPTCFNQIDSFQQNGQPIKAQVDLFRRYFTFIHR